MRQTQKNLLLGELADLKAQEAEIKRLHPHDFFKPLPGGQVAFWLSKLKEKWLFGGNQVGKTITMVNYIIDRMLKVPKSRWYLGSTSFERSRKVTQKKFMEWCNKDALVPGCTYRDDLGFPNDMARFRNGSVCLFLSYEMDAEKWAGDTVNGVGFDEEPPWHIFSEAQKRVIALDGELIGAMTALKGYSKLVERIYLNRSPRIGVFNVPLHENHVRYGGLFTDQRIMEIIEETDKDERPAKIYGIPTLKTGLIHKDWKDEWPFVVPREHEFAIPHQWSRYIAIDPHGDLPQAALCIAVAPNHQMFAYKEIWEKCLIPELARKIRDIATPIDFETYLIDNHYATQKNSESGKTIKDLLLEYGDIYTVGGCDDVVARLSMVKVWDKINPSTGLPMLQTFESCEQTRWERLRYEWAAPISERIGERRDAPQEPKRKNNHLMNCLEYLAAYGGRDGLPYIVPPLPSDVQDRVCERELAEAMAEESPDEDYDFDTVCEHLM